MASTRSNARPRHFKDTILEMLIMIVACAAVMFGLVLGLMWLVQQTYNSWGPPAHQQMEKQLSDYYGVKIQLDYTIGFGQGTVTAGNCELRPYVEPNAHGDLRVVEGIGASKVFLTKEDLHRKLISCDSAADDK